MADSSNKPIIAVTIGDPAGIGPEIVGRFFSHFSPERSVALLIGSEDALAPWVSTDLPVLDAEVEGNTVRLTEPDSPAPVWIVDTGCSDSCPRGTDSEGGGRHAGLALDVAFKLCHGGLTEAVVTAPISKRSLNLAGWEYAGHTEWLADAFESPECQMMMAVGDFRVVPITRHIPINDVSKALTGDKILTAVRVTHEALVGDFGIDEPRLAVAGLNPHAGEGGVLGSEETDVIEPALERARAAGFAVDGPFPADALFQKAESGTFDAFITMYHDQGLIPFKMLAQRRGVNVTLGLPVVRTSVDHGTAYDIAGEGVAGTESLEQAYLLAEELVSRRRASK